MIVHTQNTESGIQFTKDYVTLRKLLVKKSKKINKQFLRRWIQLRGMKAVDASRHEIKAKLKTKRFRKLLKRQSGHELEELKTLRELNIEE